METKCIFFLRCYGISLDMFRLKYTYTNPMPENTIRNLKFILLPSAHFLI